MAIYGVAELAVFSLRDSEGLFQYRSYILLYHHWFQTALLITISSEFPAAKTAEELFICLYSILTVSSYSLRDGEDATTQKLLATDRASLPQ